MTSRDLPIDPDCLTARVGRALRFRRKAQGATLAQVSKNAGMSLGYLSQVEIGRNCPTIETLQKVAVALNFKLSELFRDIESYSTADSLSSSQL